MGFVFGKRKVTLSRNLTMMDFDVNVNISMIWKLEIIIYREGSVTVVIIIIREEEK